MSSSRGSLRLALELLAALSVAACADPALDGDGSVGDGSVAYDARDGDAIVDGALDGDGAPVTDAGVPVDAAPIIGLPYPVRDAYWIKGIQPDFWNIDELADDYVGAVSMNLVWANWEPSEKAPPCGGSQEEYQGHCYDIDSATDQAIKAWSDRGVVVTGIVYGVPAWARVGNTGCSPITAGFDIFCTPDDPADYGRFAGMLARRYDGLHGHGRVADFVIHNEVNTNAWFDIGCGQGTPCDAESWITTYADNYAAAYDQIVQYQSEARVLLSFEHHFDTAYDLPADDNAMISVKTFVTGFAARIGDRKWRIAYHPYPPNLLSPEFSPLDLPRVTYGNLGVIVAWLRATFPDQPQAWEVQLTESGISSGAPTSNEAAQAPAVCDTLRNVLGTPGVTSYIYHRMKDHPTEGQLQVGLARENGTLKPAWSVWANANRIDDEPPQLDCGFEDLPYTRLTRSTNGEFLAAHWTSSRRPPSGFDAEQSWFLLRDPAPGTQLLYECMVDPGVIDENTFLSPEIGCSGSVDLGPVGYIYSSQVPDSVALYSCTSSTGWDHFVSTDPGCEGATAAGLLGYALPAS